jgi:hypothetical protein
MLTYNDLTAQAESVIRGYLDQAAAARDYLDERMSRCYAYGAYLLWSAVAHQAALNVSHAAVNEYEADRNRLNAPLDAGKQVSS